MHEQSETIQRPRGYYNVYGGTEYPIPKEFSFENQPYATQEQAVQSARWRSRMDAGHYVGASPSYGFSNSYQPSPQAQAFGAVLNALQDPRNQWMGTGMVGGTIRGLGGLRNFFADKAAAKAGGFNIPLSKMQKDMPGIRSYGSKGSTGSIEDQKAFEKLGFDTETAQDIINTKSPGQRGGYLNQVEDANLMATSMRKGNMLESLKTREGYELLDGKMQEEINRAMMGQKALEDLNRRAFTQTEGPPPEMVRRLFGL